jgi:hypothetical protein
MKPAELLDEMILTEAAALTKGSQRVMNDRRLVAGLADTMRDDARSHPHNFPPNSSRTFQKAPDEELAQWFLENLDKIEKEGYEGTIYSRDGVYSDWIVRRYIAGAHNWEDITGVMNMNLRDWTILKNRNLLDPNHKDIPKFNSVRDIGKYMNTHYEDKLRDVRDAAKNAARNKMAKSVKLIDNDDYRVYTTLNRAAGCALGLGTQWCTANSSSGTHFHNYSNRGMLFQVFPYAKEEKDGEITNTVNDEGKPVLNDKHKFQFDAGGKDMSPNFMDITDTPVKPAIVAEKFPYLFTDLAKALKQNKSKMEQAFKELSADPTLQGEDFKIKSYEIDDEIKKLQKLVDKGYFTDQVRPRAKGSSADAPEGGRPEALPAPQPQEGNPTMENVDKDVAAMLASLKKYDKLVESVAPVMGMVTLNAKPQLNELSQETLKSYKGAARDDGRMGMIKGDQAKMDKRAAGMKAADKRIAENEPLEEKKGDLPPWLKDKKAGGPEDSADSEGGDTDVKKDDKKKDKVDEDTGADAEVLTWMKRFASLGKMG